jgi:hypothetical protein
LTPCLALEPCACDSPAIGEAADAVVDAFRRQDADALRADATVLDMSARCATVPVSTEVAAGLLWASALVAYFERDPAWEAWIDGALRAGLDVPLPAEIIPAGHPLAVAANRPLEPCAIRDGEAPRFGKLWVNGVQSSTGCDGVPAVVQLQDAEGKTILSVIAEPSALPVWPAVPRARAWVAGRRIPPATWVAGSAALVLAGGSVAAWVQRDRAIARFEDRTADPSVEEIRASAGAANIWQSVSIGAGMASIAAVGSGLALALVERTQ